MVIVSQENDLQNIFENLVYAYLVMDTYITDGFQLQFDAK